MPTIPCNKLDAVTKRRQFATTSGICDSASGLGSSADGCGEPNSLPTTETVQYDPDNNVTDYTDANGSIQLCGNDSLDRITSCSIMRLRAPAEIIERQRRWDHRRSPAARVLSRAGRTGR